MSREERFDHDLDLFYAMRIRDAQVCPICGARYDGGGTMNWAMEHLREVGQ